MIVYMEMVLAATIWSMSLGFLVFALGTSSTPFILFFSAFSCLFTFILGERIYQQVRRLITQSILHQLGYNPAYTNALPPAKNQVKSKPSKPSSDEFADFAVANVGFTNAIIHDIVGDSNKINEVPAEPTSALPTHLESVQFEAYTPSNFFSSLAALDDLHETLRPIKGSTLILCNLEITRTKISLVDQLFDLRKLPEFLMKEIYPKCDVIDSLGLIETYHTPLLQQFLKDMSRNYKRVVI